MIVTKHATKRMAQRSIKMSEIDLIITLGTCKPRPGGAVEYYIKRENISSMISELKHIMKQIDRLANKAVLMTNNRIKTVYHKT
ncbi:hypothetical protein JW935_08665 [candidate division KSB1 bacterium]|nr:hypothetical protein [candidate division KSB1 bacterium]